MSHRVDYRSLVVEQPVGSPRAGSQALSALQHPQIYALSALAQVIVLHTVVAALLECDIEFGKVQNVNTSELVVLIDWIVVVVADAAVRH